jgi:hypothetical protein
MGFNPVQHALNCCMLLCQCAAAATVVNQAAASIDCVGHVVVAQLKFEKLHMQ